MKYLWPQVFRLHERFTFLQNQTEQLKKQEKEQMAHREKYARLVHGPRLSKEIIHGIISLIPTDNRLVFQDYNHRAYVDNILPHAVFNPHLLEPYYHRERYNAAWTLEDIAEQEMSLDLLDDAFLWNDITLRINLREALYNLDDWYYLDELEDFVEFLRLNKAPHRLRMVKVDGKLVVNDFIRAFKHCIPHLEELKLDECKILEPISQNLTDLDCGSLKTVTVDFDSFPAFFSTGIQFISLSHLILYSWVPDLSDNSISNAVHMISQLPHLEELCMPCVRRESNSLDNIAKVKSTSLRSLNVNDSPALFPLFSNCQIKCINMGSEYLKQSAMFFPDVRDIQTGVSSSIHNFFRDTDLFSHIGSRPRSAL